MAAIATKQSYADWDPFTDACDSLQGRTTEYASLGDSGLVQGPGEDWDPFEDHEMLELTGEIAMEADDVEAIEAWIEQARAAGLPREKILPKDNRLRDLKWRREDLRKRKVVKERLDSAMRGSDWAKLREAIGDSARAGVAHPMQLREATLQLQSLRSAEAEFFRRKDAVDTERRDEENLAIAEIASEKLWRKALVPSLDVEVTDEERGALEWVLCRPRPSTMDVRICFPSGDEEVVLVPSAANTAALLTALVPVRARHRIPQNLALFAASGERLRLDRPLQAQGVRSGSCVRVDDAERGARVQAAGSGAEEAAAAASHSRLDLAVSSRGPRLTGGSQTAWAGAARALAGVIAGQPPAGRPRMAASMKAGDVSYIVRYAALAQSSQRQRLPLALCDALVAAEVVGQDRSEGEGAILQWMREYMREVVHGEAPQSSGGGAGPDSLFEEYEQAVEAEAEARLDEEDMTRFEVDECWVHVYWPLSYAKPALSDFRLELRKHAEVVVIGWNAAGDKEIMKLSLEVCELARAGYFIATGDVPPAEGSMPVDPVKSSFLRLATHAENRELGREVHRKLREEGMGDSKAVVVVSRTYQSKRIALSLDFFRGPQPRKPLSKEEKAKTSLAIIPYCLEPQESVLQDCMDRKVDVLIEAQLLVEMDHRVLNSQATEALSQLLEVFPPPKRPNWEAGVLRIPERRAETAEQGGAPESEEEEDEEEADGEEPEEEAAKAESEAALEGAAASPAEAERSQGLLLCQSKLDLGPGPRVKQAVEFRDNDDDLVLFMLNNGGGLDCYINGHRKLIDVTAFRIDAERVMRFKGTAAPGSPSANWRVTVKVGQEALAKSVEDLFGRRHELQGPPTVNVAAWTSVEQLFEWRSGRPIDKGQFFRPPEPTRHGLC